MHRESEENLVEPESGYSVSWLRLEPTTSIIKDVNVTTTPFCAVVMMMMMMMTATTRETSHENVVAYRRF
jgi:hypothetical protein